MSADRDSSAAKRRDGLVVKLHRFRGGTWSVAVRYPDGSTEGRRGLVDAGHAGCVVADIISDWERRHV